MGMKLLGIPLIEVWSQNFLTDAHLKKEFTCIHAS